MGLYCNKPFHMYISILLITTVTSRFLDEAAHSDINAVRIRLTEEKSQRLLLKNDVESLMVKVGEVEQKINVKPSEISAEESSSRKICFNAKLTEHMDIDSLHIIPFDKVLTNVETGTVQVPAYLVHQRPVRICCLLLYYPEQKVNTSIFS